jgi:hypothetical protein
MYSSSRDPRSAPPSRQLDLFDPERLRLTPETERAAEEAADQQYLAYLREQQKTLPTTRIARSCPEIPSGIRGRGEPPTPGQSKVRPRLNLECSRPASDPRNVSPFSAASISASAHPTRWTRRLPRAR